MVKITTEVEDYRTRPLPRAKVVRRYVKPSYNYLAMFIFSLIGLLFSGFLTYQKMYAGVCTFAEGCSIIAGLPSCFYGAALFFLLTIFSLISFASNYKFLKAIRLFSAVGLIFSGVLLVYELFFAPSNILNGASYTLFLPVCFYGFLVYLIVNSLSR